MGAIGWQAEQMMEGVALDELINGDWEMLFTNSELVQTAQLLATLCTEHAALPS